jgi:hypothetical protein
MDKEKKGERGSENSTHSAEVEATSARRQNNGDQALKTHIEQQRSTPNESIST